jgi:hypothetical protein
VNVQLPDARLFLASVPQSRSQQEREKSPEGWGVAPDSF